MSIKLKGSSYGSVTLQAPDDTSPTGTDKTFTLPTQDGDAGQILKTDGSGALSFTDNLSSGRNLIINGDMRIDQRNAGGSVTPITASYTLDRWQAIQSTDGKFSVQRNAGSVAPPTGFTNYLGVTSLSAYSVAADDFYQIKHHVEGFNVADLDWGTAAAKTVTLSFWVRSSLTGNFGVVASWGSSGSNERTYPILYTISSANTWEYKTITIPGDTTAAAGGFEVGSGSGIQVRFSLGGGATEAGTSGSWAAANNQTVTGDTSVVGTNGATFYITGVQLEVGSVATTFERRNYGDELQKCKRYYQNAGSTHYGAVEGTDRFRLQIPLYPHMRAAPTCTVRTGKKFNTRYAGDTTITTPTIADLTSSPQNIWTGVTSSGLTAGTPIYGRSQQGADGDFLSVNAEL